jgi:paraquat-inducible protein A
MSAPTAAADWVICEHCDALYRRVALPPGRRADCRCCGKPLYEDRPWDPTAALALSLTALLLFGIANAFPVLSMELAGQRIDMPLWMAILALGEAGQPLVAVMAAATMWGFPLLLILLHLYLLTPLSRGRRPAQAIPMLHLLRHARPWSMLEVFVIGVLVSLVKLGDFATVVLGPGLAAIALLTLALIRLGTLDAGRYWTLAVGPLR